jgi:hypothetical protein
VVEGGQPELAVESYSEHTQCRWLQITSDSLGNVDSGDFRDSSAAKWDPWTREYDWEQTSSPSYVPVATKTIHMVKAMRESRSMVSSRARL